MLPKPRGGSWLLLFRLLRVYFRSDRFPPIVCVFSLIKTFAKFASLAANERMRERDGDADVRRCIAYVTPSEEE
uniref:Secreted protein n=1 Tax=Caenorhabditis japonica TaxID=281687 RepID=A0A8R1EFG9_CAEJA